MNFFRSLLPATIPSQFTSKGELITLRERILQSILLFTAGFGFITYVIVFITLMVRKLWVEGIFLTVAMAILILAALIRKWSIISRAYMLLLIIYGAGLWVFIRNGLAGDGRMLLLTFTILTTVLLGLRSGIISLIFSIVTMLIFSIGVGPGIFHIPQLDAIAGAQSQYDWLIATILFSLLGTMGTISLGVLVNSLNQSLTKQTDIAGNMEAERVSLEQHVQHRTEEIERKMVQIRTAGEISRAISSVLNPQSLLQQVVDLIHDRFNLYYVGAFLIEKNGEFAVLQAGTGEAGQQMMEAGHRLPVGGSSMIGWATANKQARIALDVGDEAVRFNNPYLPETRSELALPILGRMSVLGALSIQSIEASAFDADDITILQGIADSLAIALENARLFQQTQENLEEIQSLNRAYLLHGWQEFIDQAEQLSYSFDNTSVPKSEKPGENILIPITLRDQTIGQLEIETDSAELSFDEKNLVDAITVQTALALENARLLQETQQHAAQEEKVNEMTANLSRAATIQDILKTALEELGHLPSITEVSVHLTPPEGVTPVAETPLGGGNGKENAG
jgi:GAF domain-containing protein